jgi:predicted GNAT family N-acyltransferase
MTIKEINASDTTAIRHQILRTGQPIETCFYPGDNDSNTFHLGVFEKDRLVSIASFYKENQSDIPLTVQYRFRGIATLPPFRNRGFAAAMINSAIKKLKTKNVEVIWCNARTSALGLYKKLGFKIVSDEFEIEGIGAHVVMRKRI